MDNVIKIGDYVILVDGRGLFNIEKNRPYKVLNIEINNRGSGNLLELEGDFYSEDTNEVAQFNSRRFKKDIRHERKMKLDNIINKYG